MQVYKVHKRRVLAVAMTMGAVVFLAAVATINSSQMLDIEWTYGGDVGGGGGGGGGGEEEDYTRLQNNGTLSRFRYDVLSESSNTSVETGDELSNRSRSDKVVKRYEAAAAVASEDEESYGDERYGEIEGPNDVLGEYDDRNEDVIGEYDDYGSENDEEEDEENENGVFRDGDFDNNSNNNRLTNGSSDVSDVRKNNTSVAWSTRRFTTPTDRSESFDDFSNNGNVDRKLQFKSESIEAPISTMPTVDVVKPSLESVSTSRLVKRRSLVTNPVEDSIFWSSELQSLAPKGFSDDYVRTFQNRMRHLSVINMEPPTWNRCGRPKNQFVTLSDGSHACARYRSPHDYLVQGEVLSFYLARLLGIQNVPIVVLSKVDPLSSAQWKGNGSNETSMDSLLVAAEWELNTTVALIQWIDGLERDRMPELIRNALQSGKTIYAGQKRLREASQDTLIELLQWSNLIVFDYITGNYDRVASMQDAAEKENRPSLFDDTIHNLVKSRSDGGLWLIDNESGLLDAYSLMYSRTHPTQGKRFVEFQSQMLRTNCLFSRNTYNRVETLSRSRNAHKLLLETVFREEPLFEQLLPGNVDFAKRLQQRIDEVYEWMIGCHLRSK